MRAHAGIIGDLGAMQKRTMAQAALDFQKSPIGAFGGKAMANRRQKTHSARK